MSLLSRIAVEAARAYGMFAKKGGISASYLVVAGGGGGGGGRGGGGGGGGYQASTFSLSALNTYSIVVGAGGNGGIGYNGTPSNGSNSVVSGTGITTITSIGGGYGANQSSSATGTNGSNGGSGGGGVTDSVSGTSFGTGGTATSGQGNNGGTSAGASNYPGGGGGGAGAVGSNATSTTGGNGGNGSASSISGSSVTYAGGGGGGTYNGGTAGSGGTGGGGAAGAGSSTTVNNGTAGTANLGGGGGAGNQPISGYGNGGAGGSGIVIISYASATPLFVGGTLTTSGGNQIHTFTSSGTLSPITPITASYLVVAGGGGGGFGGGGGGAGGLLTSTTTLYSGAAYVVTVGAGGNGSNTVAVTGSSGSNSVLSGTGLTTITSTGGGGGGSYNSPSGVAGLNGGSGGGGGMAENGTPGAPGNGTSGQGNNGGTAGNRGGAGSYPGCGGGGGAGAVGGNYSSTTGGAGGAGSASSISGTSTTYAGGGGGGGYNGIGGAGGSGGGGAGASSTAGGTAGTANTGGGGGGNGTTLGGQGGSGIVIISYAGSQVFNGGLVTTSGGNTIHTFTSTGALTPLTNNLNNSLRFRSSASAYLSRTFATTGTSRTTFTFSCWIKRGVLGVAQRIMDCYDGSSGASTVLLFDAGDTLTFSFGNGSAAQLTTTQVFRDPAAWYHIVVKVDTTQATAANRGSIYINGNQVTAFSTATYPTQNLSCDWMYNNANNKIMAQWSGGSAYTDGYLADVNFIDGQALEPYYFGNNDANGVWKPILYKGTYGTNGFYLTFGNTTSTTTLGYDSSPNGNNWTCNNISLTAGTTYDAMLDVPTNTSATVANYAVLNPLQSGTTNLTLSNANLSISQGNTTTQITRGTIALPTTGKWYWEATITSTSPDLPGIGIIDITNTSSALAAGVYTYTGVASSSYSNGSFINYGATFTNGDVIGVAFDADAGTLVFYKNNSSQGTFASSLTATYAPAIAGRQNGTSGSCAVNFGQRPFSYTPPTGYVALNTYNLPTPTILQGNKYMDATLYTGTGVSNTVVNQGQFKPDLVWMKARNAAQWNLLFDSVRGVGKWLTSNNTTAEVTDATSLTAFNSNGFAVSTDPAVSADTGWNASGNTMVGWQWQAGQGSTSSGTGTGGITNVVQSVNTTAGFSIVTFTIGTISSAATVTHGLGVAPKLIITKDRAVGTIGWSTYHASIGNTAYVQLNTTAAAATLSTAWNNTSPTSTVFTMGTAFTGYGNYLAYCWAEIAGFSKFGSYTGNSSTDGPFVYLGFRPKYILIKCTSAGYDWVIYDSSTGAYNVVSNNLWANLSNAEYSNTASTGLLVDLVSNGFKIRGTNTEVNNSGLTYIYAAFAENPFKNANAR